jgi:hypothetical protein
MGTLRVIFFFEAVYLMVLKLRLYSPPQSHESQFFPLQTLIFFPSHSCSLCPPSLPSSFHIFYPVTSVVDLDPFDMDLDPAFHFDTDLDAAFQFDTDSDLTV